MRHAHPIVLTVALLAVCAVVALRLGVALPKPPEARLPAAPATLADNPDADVRLHRSLASLRERADRSAAREVRDALWEIVGAGDCDTLEDALRQASSARVREALLAAERAAFVADDDVSHAIAALLASVGT